MNAYKRIFLDIDGVCNRFCWWVFKNLGIPYASDADYPGHLPEMVDAANYILGHQRFTNESFWRQVTRDIWAECPPSQEFFYLVNRSMEMVGRENVFFLTSPTRDPDCLAGKVEWIQKYAPHWMHRQYLIGPPKFCCAHPDALLIDDTEKQVNRFIEHGGHGLLVPRPWNVLRGVNTAEYLATALR